MARWFCGRRSGTGQPGLQARRFPGLDCTVGRSCSTGSADLDYPCSPAAGAKKGLGKIIDDIADGVTRSPFRWLTAWINALKAGSLGKGVPA